MSDTIVISDDGTVVQVIEGAASTVQVVEDVVTLVVQTECVQGPPGPQGPPGIPGDGNIDNVSLDGGNF